MSLTKKNIKENWTLHFMIYPSSTKKNWYTAVCLDLALVRDGKDIIKLMHQMNYLALKYVSSIKKSNLDDSLLNQKLPKRYTKKYNDILKKQKQLQKEGEEELERQKWQKVMEAMLWEKNPNTIKDRASV